MKIYVVYFRTMQDSPEVEIKCITTSKRLAEAKFKDAKREEEEWMADVDEESGNWAEACIQIFDGVSSAYGPFSLLYVTVETSWCEEVTTKLHLNGTMPSAMDYVSLRKRILINEDPDLEPYDEDETIEESMHLHNPDVMSDYYFSIESVIVE